MGCDSRDLGCVHELKPEGLADGLLMGVKEQNRVLFQGVLLERMKPPYTDTGKNFGEAILEVLGETRDSVWNILNLRCSLYL